MKTELTIKAIDTVKDIDEMSDLIGYAKDKKAELLDKVWENLYKERCPEHFISYSEVLKAIDRTNWLMNEEGRKEFNEYFDILKIRENHAQISEIILIAKLYNLQIPPEVGAMICEACACEGCPYMEEHLFHTCKECKKVKYSYYEGYCDE